MEKQTSSGASVIPETGRRVTLVECPRDAMQGWEHFIPTDRKSAYLNALLRVGFDVLDFGSFVSHRAVPQMADTAAVLQDLIIPAEGTKLLAIVANMRGAEEASAYDVITYLGYPFSVSETFQLRNTGRTVADALELVENLQALCTSRHKELVIYFSMGFGNPYGDPYDEGVIDHWLGRLSAMGIRQFSLADTVGMAKPPAISRLFKQLIPAYPEVVLGAHFHSHPLHWEEKIAAAYDAGCRRFDAALGGFGGCPMAADELVGNIATENLVGFFQRRGRPLSLDMEAFRQAAAMATSLFTG